MGNRPLKIQGCAPSEGNQRAENDRDPVSLPASESSSRKVKATPQVHCTEVLIAHNSTKEEEVYILVSSEDSEGESLQENLRNSGEMPSVAVTSGPSEVASGILGEADVTPDSTAETAIETEIRPSGLDSLCESCRLLLPDASLALPPETFKAGSSAAPTPDCSTEEEARAVSVGMAEPQTATEDLYPSAGLSKGTEVPGSEGASCEKNLELPIDNVQGAAEEHTTEQKEFDESASEEAVQRTAEPHPDSMSVKTPDRPSLITAVPAHERLAEGHTGPQKHQPLSLSEMEGEIPEERSAMTSWKETEDLSSPREVSTETELPPNDQKVPSEMGLELPTENARVTAETPTTSPRQLDDEASPEKAADAESRLDSTLIETSGGSSGMGTAPGTKQLDEERSVPGNDLPLAATEMEDKVSGDGSGAESMEEVAKALSSQLEMRPMEAQGKTLARVEAGDETECPVASSSPLEEELGCTLTAQSLSTSEESPDSDVRRLGEAEFLNAAQVDEASSTTEVVHAEAQTVVQAQASAELTMPQSSPKPLQGAAETMKELEEAGLDQPHAEENIEQARSPDMQLLPEASPGPGTPLWVPGEDEEEEEYFEANDCKDAEVPAWDGVLEAQEEDNGKDEPLQEVPVGSPRLIPDANDRKDTDVLAWDRVLEGQEKDNGKDQPVQEVPVRSEEAEEETLVHTDAEK